METLPVTLIVKAPNQQIEDQTIQCELSWTINKLKQHLSEVYPSKPPKQEQKLIYSGKLLNDSVILKDVLRQYDGQDTHTVHLVCTPKYTTIPASTSAAKKSQPEMTNDVHENPTNDENQPDQRLPNLQWFNQNNPQNLDQYTMHMLMMQQAYMQYMTQYMYVASQQGNQLYIDNGHHNPLNDQQQPNIAAQQQHHQQQQQQQQQQALQQQQNDPEMNRDWLDVFYMLIRFMIFISIVYFYSSPIRCVLVVGFGFCLYLYQIGFFRYVNINNNNIMQQGGEAGAEPQAPSRLMVLWTFFTTFFTSLLPEIPNVI